MNFDYTDEQSMLDVIKLLDLPVIVVARRVGRRRGARRSRGPHRTARSLPALDKSIAECNLSACGHHGRTMAARRRRRVALSR